MKKYIAVWMFALLATLGAKGHPGGHYTTADISSLHHWAINSESGPLVGNFMMFRKNVVFVEGVAGKIWQLPYSAITGNDKAYVDAIINKIKNINGVDTQGQVIYKKNTPFNFFQLFLFFLFVSFSLFFFKKGITAKKQQQSIIPRVTFSLMVVFFLLVALVACKKSKVDPSPVQPPSGNGIPKTTTSFIDSAFEPYKPLVGTSWDTTYFHVSSTGFPYSNIDMNMMVGITSWQQQVPIPQSYTGANSWSIPLQPVYATIPLSTRTNLMKGAVAIAVNGIPIFNALNNRGEDSYAIGELDQWGGHCGRADDYHYHAAPLHLSGTSGLLPIAFALDGFPVYGSLEPNGSTMTSLDTCHGHVGTNGVYHYHGTTTYPYVVGAMRGQVALDPATTAPENQILPQAFASPVRPATTPLRNAHITAFTHPSLNHYLLTYQITNKYGYVEYSWDANNLYTYTLTDTAGVSVTNTYQRR